METQSRLMVRKFVFQVSMHPKAIIVEKSRYAIWIEKKVFCGELSKEKLKEKIGTNSITCEREKDKDFYGRTLAECFINDESLSKFMVRNGYAFDYTRYSKKKIC